MNNLSWFVQFADILPNVAGFSIFLTLTFGVLTVIYIVVKGFANVGDEDAKAFVDIPIIKNATFLFAITSFLVIFTPSKEAIYMIAGSEAGEYVASTPEAKAILGDIREVIQLQLEELKPNDS